MTKYDEKFYATRDGKTSYAARTILKMVFDKRDIKTVVDFGCGVGTWLKTAEEYGADHTVGIEGEWIDHNLFTAKGELKVSDFEKPIELEKRFDLAICLEVAEHITPTSAHRFISDLCKSSDLILFSAAVAGQGGRGHVNEQNQSYWVELFMSKGYKCFDVIRPVIWNDNDIDVWYRQNSFVFSKDPSAFSVSQDTDFPVDIIHPDLFRTYREPGIYMTVKAVLKLPSLILKKIGRKASG